MNIKVSVTVPVYNTSAYLRQCLDSLKKQSLPEIEFILVDDGSTDGSGRICDEYAADDSRFKVIHRKNGGLAVARQTGLELTRGEYVIVCDSDDWAEPDMYEKLYSKAKETNADIAACGYLAEYNDGRSIPCQTVFKEHDGIVDNFDFIERGAGSSWVKLVRKSLFEKAGACYEPGVNLSEDVLILLKLMKGNPRVVQISGNLYHYRRLYGNQSYTNSVKMTHIKQLEFTYEWFKQNYTDQKFRPLVHRRAIDLAFACLRASDTDKEYLRAFLSNEIEWKSFLSDRFGLKPMMVAGEKVFPLWLMKLILKALYPLVYK